MALTTNCSSYRLSCLWLLAIFLNQNWILFALLSKIQMGQIDITSKLFIGWSLSICFFFVTSPLIVCFFCLQKLQYTKENLHHPFNTTSLLIYCAWFPIGNIQVIGMFNNDTTVHLFKRIRHLSVIDRMSLFLHLSLSISFLYFFLRTSKFSSNRHRKLQPFRETWDSVIVVLYERESREIFVLI